MNQQTTCNKCGRDFTIETSTCGTLEDGELSVQYFSCPGCGAKFHVFTADSRMRELVKARQSVQRKIGLARKKKFREKEIRGYLSEFDRILAEQKRLMPLLKKQGEELLRKQNTFEEE